MLISMFGWYVVPSIGIRLEHLVIYSLLVFLSVTNNLSLKNDAVIFLIVTCLLVNVFVPLIGFCLYDKVLTSTLAISQFENYSQMLSIVLIVFSSFRASDYNQVKGYFHYLIKVFIILMALHTFISIGMLLFPTFNFWNAFTGNSFITELPTEVNMTAAQLARSAGRSSGIFTQIFEAGYAYAIALVSWVYLYNALSKFIKFQNIVLYLIIIGGFISYSKVFLVLGLVSFVFLANKTFLLKVVSVLFICLFVPFLLNIEIGVFNKGLIYFKRLIFIDSGHSLIDVYTSGRFSDESIILKNMGDIFLNSPLIGYGYGSIKTSDFSLYEVLSLGGVVGILMYFILFLLLFFSCFLIKDRDIKKYYFCIVGITLVSSLSAPVISANRVSVIFWIISATIITLGSTQTKNLKRVS